MTRLELLSFVNSMELTESDYTVLLNLTNATTPKLFTKIIEEIALGNLFINDFKSIYGENFKKDIANLIEEQTKLENKVKRLVNFRKYINTNFINNIIVDHTIDDYSEFLKEEKLDLIYTYLNDDPLTTEILLLNGYNMKDRSLEDLVDTFLFSRDNFMIPIQHKDILLNKYDKNFMMNHNMTEDEMRKMKSLVYYIMHKNGGTL